MIPYILPALLWPAYASERIEIPFEPEETYPLFWAADPVKATGRSKSGSCEEALADAMDKARHPPAVGMRATFHSATWKPFALQDQETNSTEFATCEPVGKKGKVRVQLEGTRIAMPTSSSFRSILLTRDEAERVALVLEQHKTHLSEIDSKPYLYEKVRGSSFDVIPGSFNERQRAALVFEKLVTEGELAAAYRIAGQLDPWVVGLQIRVTDVRHQEGASETQEHWLFTLTTAEAAQAAGHHDQMAEVLRNTMVMLDPADETEDWRRVVVDTTVLAGQRTPAPSGSALDAPSVASEDDLPTKLMKLKLSLDAGLINQEEFDAKKKQLLEQM